MTPCLLIFWLYLDVQNYMITVVIHYCNTAPLHIRKHYFDTFKQHSSSKLNPSTLCGSKKSCRKLEACLSKYELLLASGIQFLNNDILTYNDVPRLIRKDFWLCSRNLAKKSERLRFSDRNPPLFPIIKPIKHPRVITV